MAEIVTVVGISGLATRRTFHKRGQAELFWNSTRQQSHVTYIQWVWENGSVWGFRPDLDKTVLCIRPAE